MCFQKMPKNDLRNVLVVLLTTTQYCPILTHHNSCIYIEIYL